MTISREAKELESAGKDEEALDHYMMAMVGQVRPEIEIEIRILVQGARSDRRGDRCGRALREARSESGRRLVQPLVLSLLAGDLAGAIEALDWAVRLAPANDHQAVADADFASIRRDERFLAITA